MAVKNKAIDAYIAKSADFAKPVLDHIRKLVHSSCPAVEEKMKWSFPHFDYKGEMMCSMAAFKQHAVFGFWKAALMKDRVLVETARSEVAMGHLGRITSLKDLPPDKKMVAWIKEAMALNDKGIKLAAKPKTAGKKELIIPDYFIKAIAKNKKALNNYNSFSPSYRKSYLYWLNQAKREETRTSRIAQIISFCEQNIKSRDTF